MNVKSKKIRWARTKDELLWFKEYFVFEQATVTPLT